MPKYSKAVEPREIAQRWIDNLHTDLQHVRLDCLFVDKEIKVNGRRVAAKPSVVSGDSREGYYASGRNRPADFACIEVDKLLWDRLRPEQKDFVMDHYLSCFYRDEEGKLKKLGPDISLFVNVVKRHPADVWEEIHKLATVLREKPLAPYEHPSLFDDDRDGGDDFGGDRPEGFRGGYGGAGDDDDDDVISHNN